MADKLRVIFVSSEVSPFAKSGELADAASTLPKYLARLGLSVAVFMPRYRRPEIDALPKELAAAELAVPMSGDKVKAGVYRSDLPGYSIYFVDNPKYFHRDTVYGSPKGDYPDNDERFIFFSRAVPEFLLREGMAADIIHCHNWPTALIPAFLKIHYGRRALLRNTATVLTIHNAAYQGEFPLDSMSLAGIGWDDLAPRRLAFNGKFNFLKAGISFSTVTNTVSQAYRDEVLKPGNASGLQDILRNSRDTFLAIRNGVDYDEWNPAKDAFIAAPFSPADPGGKAGCKSDLIREFGLSCRAGTPLVAIASYLTRHKGLDLVAEAARELTALDLGLVVLGHGDEKYEDLFRRMRSECPERVGIRFEMTPPLMHKVLAGADMLLVPSLEEPCGLSHLYGFRYGTVPVARATGGLKETVIPFDPLTGKGNGFVFKRFSAKALLDALKEALDAYRRPSDWREIMRQGFVQDFSLEKAARKYVNLYEKAIFIQKGGLDVR